MGEVRVGVLASADAEGTWVDDVVRAASESDCRVFPQPRERQLPEVVADVTVVLTVVAAVEHVVGFVLTLTNRAKVGLIIDLRPEVPTVMADSSLPRGHVYVIDAEGGWREEVVEGPSGGLPSLLRALRSSP